MVKYAKPNQSLNKSKRFERIMNKFQTPSTEKNCSSGENKWKKKPKR
jgi:hypothetical protein